MKHSKSKPKNQPTQTVWPHRFPNDHPVVSAILDEAERLAELGTLAARKPNPVAADFCYRNAWAFSLVGNWLRCCINSDEILAHKKVKKALKP